MTSDRRRLDDLAGAVVDGDAVDWTSADRDLDASSRPVLEYLRVIAAVADLHRTAASCERADESPGAVTWGHLRLLEGIGRGAYGDVYRAWDTTLEREVALKLLPEDPTNAGRRSTMLREGRLLARVRHPNVVTIHGAEHIGGRTGLWMELVRGRTLDAHLDRHGPLAVEDVVRIGCELAHAVHAVHDAGVVHGDIKAQNVMLGDDGRVVLMDFGAGHDVAQGGGDLTATPLYVAPEILARGEATQESDVYSLGVLLFHLLTGSYPVTAGTVGELRRAHAEGTRSSLRAMRPDVPFGIARAIERAMDPVPERRHRTPSDLGADLKSGGGHPARTWIIGGAVAATAILAMATWLAGSREAPRLVVGVLPFQNLNADPGADLVADGLTAEFIGSLTAIDGLDVRSAASDSALQRGPRDIAEAGRQLGAGHVLDASVLSGGGEFRVSARLVRLKDGSTVWADSFAAREAEPLPIQSRLALAVVNSLRVKLGRGERRYQTRPEVYYQFLRARGLQLRREPQYAVQAVELFEKVAASDPTFAPAFAGLARSLGDIARLNRERDPGPLDPRLEAATLEALRLDPLMADAQSALGMLYALDREWRQAEAAFTRALELNPNATATHTDFVLTVLLPLGRLDAATALLEKARMIDPLSLDVRRVLALVQVESAPTSRRSLRAAGFSNAIRIFHLPAPGWAEH